MRELIELFSYGAMIFCFGMAAVMQVSRWIEMILERYRKDGDSE